MILRIFLLLFYLIGAPFFISLSYFLLKTMVLFSSLFLVQMLPLRPFFISFIFYIMVHHDTVSLFLITLILLSLIFYLVILLSVYLFYLLYDGAPWQGWRRVSLFLITFIFLSFHLYISFIFSIMVHHDTGEGLSLFFSSPLSSFYHQWGRPHIRRGGPFNKWGIISPPTDAVFSVKHILLENIFSSKSFLVWTDHNFLPEILLPRLNAPKPILTEIFRRQKFTSPQNLQKFRARKNWIGVEFSHHRLFWRESRQLKSKSSYQPR